MKEKKCQEGFRVGKKRKIKFSLDIVSIIHPWEDNPNIQIVNKGEISSRQVCWKTFRDWMDHRLDMRL